MIILHHSLLLKRKRLINVIYGLLEKFDTLYTCWPNSEVDIPLSASLILSNPLILPPGRKIAKSGDVFKFFGLVEWENSNSINACVQDFMAGGCVLGTTWSLKLTFNPLVLPRVISITFDVYM